MKKAILHFVWSALLLIGVTAISIAQQSSTLDVPRTISYQGLLTSNDGTPLPNGVYDITVTLYADETGANGIWQGTYHADVLNGVFNIHLGSGNAPLPEPAQMNRPLWVGTSINGSGLMTPLTPLTSSPYALNLPDQAVTTTKLADGAVTAEKVDMDYISELQIDGQKVSAKGTVLNLVSTPNVPLNYDEMTRSITVGRLPVQTGDKEKGAGVLVNQDQVWSSIGDGWDIAAGAGYIPVAGDWIGTTAAAAIPFDIRTWGTPVMRYHTPAAGTDPNVEGGQGGVVAVASVGSTIAGGGANTVTGDYDAIGGGQTNTIGAAGAAINYGTIGGGQNNIVQGPHSTVSGGLDNQINSGPMATIGGGANHRISAPEATIAGGHINEVRAYVGTIAGGHNNLVGIGGDAGFIGGGRNNTVDAPVTTIAGGWMNTVSNTAPEGTIAGGHNNRVDSYVGAITGGHDNVVSTTSEAGFIGGGRNNTVNARIGTIPGGDWLLTNNSYAQSAMGFANAPRGAVGFRPAPMALTNDPLFMVGNGDLSALPMITRGNAFEVSYNGHSVVSHTNGSGAANSAVTGGTYEDNVIYGWAEVDANGALICNDFGIASIAHVAGTGVYRVTLNVTQPDGVTAATINCGAAVATLGTGTDPATSMPGAPPTLSCAYIWTTNIVNNVFDVFITQRGPGNDCSTGTDRPFKFHVTGRP
jgi:hypothetical protein